MFWLDSPPGGLEPFQIVSHSLLNTKEFEDLTFIKELKLFIKHFVQAPDEMKEKLAENGIYKRVLIELDNVKDLLEPTLNSLDNLGSNWNNCSVILEYQNSLTRLRTLSMISRMKYSIVENTNKPTGNEYYGINFYHGYKEALLQGKRVFRMISRRDSYFSSRDPKLYKEAEKKYFEESLKYFDQLTKNKI